MSQDKNKTKAQLIDELERLRKRVAEFDEVEEALQESELRYRSLFEQAGDYILVLTVADDGVFIADANEAACRQHGYDREEFVGKSILSIDKTLTEEQAQPLLEKLMAGEALRFETVHSRKDGTVFDVEVSSKLLDTRCGPPLIVSIERDITERKLAEETLAAIESKQSTMISNISDVIGIIGKDGMMKYKSPNIEKEFGWQPQDLIGTDGWLTVHPEDLERIQKEFYTLLESDNSTTTVEYRYQCKDGGYKWIQLTAANLVNNPVIGGVLLNYHDITERKRAEKELQEKEHNLNEAQALAHIGHWRLNVHTQEVTGSAELFRIFGISEVDATLEAFTGVVHPDDRERDLSLIKRGMEFGEPWELEHRVVSGDGTEKTVYARGEARLDESGKVVELIGTTQDITERKQAEKELRDTRIELGRTVEISPGIICVANANTGYVTACNPAVERMLGYSVEEFTSKPFMEFVHPDDRQSTIDAVARQLKGSQVANFENRYRCADGSYKWLAWESTEADSDGRVYAVAADVTELKQAEQARIDFEVQVQQAQKLESLGILAGGIAHDFNNLLMGVLGNADLALASLSPLSPATASIEKVQQAATRAAELANQMLAYSGKGQFVIKAVGLSELVREMGHLLSASVSKTTNLSYQLDETIPPIEADVTQIRQVVMNLITNASESLHDDSGVVKLTTGLMECDETCQRDGYAAGECTGGTHAFVEVSDTGVGMDDETIGKIFDPFFTTKFTGRGLGLAAVFGIVRGHNGAIKVDSELGIGTTIRVLFPVTERPTESLQDSDESGTFPKVGGTVLIVDDEPTVLDVGARMLDMAGYEVLTARDGTEAIEVFREHSQDIDCVVLDLTMPKMGGEETFAELQKIKSGLRVLVSSGYSLGEVEARMSAQGIAGFIQKPYRLKELKKSIRDVLAG